ncbi:hypothetical protein DERF_011296 [Dermatophagoides farinae]|uniref:Uncharacterized protein n=1 Tax=Dermatophagoides farinae TaxID=6954 RepID=A0A922HV50_DERFA|nr:hypothetical protein DERF_011296 [Dermatophagoides farinae]
MSKSSDSKSTTTTTSGPIKMMKLIEIIRSKYGYGFTLSGIISSLKFSHLIKVKITYTKQFFLLDHPT